jgi:hypothetical protein
VKTRIYIGTPGGPVQVERIWREEGIAESMVCLKRTTEKLPIGAGYDDFVKRPSGIIEREFGPFDPGAFRLDLSAAINQGKSWQLAVFAAHALAREGLLAGPDDDYERAIWLTGQVDNDLKVGAVDHVPEKIHGALPELAALSKAGKQVLLCVPEENASALAHADIPPGIEARAVASATELRDAVGVPSSQRTAEKSAPATAPGNARLYARERKKRAIAGISFLVLGVVAIAAGVILPGELTQDKSMSTMIEAVQEMTPETVSKPVVEITAADSEGKADSAVQEPPATEKAALKPEAGAESIEVAPVGIAVPPDIAIFAVHPSGGGGCPAVHFGADNGVTAEIKSASPGEFATNFDSDLCAIEFKLAPAPGQRYLAAGIELISGRYVETEAMPTSLRGEQPVATPVTWRINLPLRMKASLEYRMHLVSSNAEISRAAYKSLQSGVVAVDEESGMAMRTTRHIVSP